MRVKTYFGGEEKLEDYVFDTLEGDAHRGQVERLEFQMKRVMSSLSILIGILVERDILNELELRAIMDELSDITFIKDKEPEFEAGQVGSR